jgi:molybdopterin-binding protein
MTDERWVTPLDARLLERLIEEPNLVRAARSLRIGRDRAVYRLARLGRLFGRVVAKGKRGGRTPGATHVTAFGTRLLARARGVGPRANLWVGVYRPGSPPRVLLGPRAEIEVTFRARPGERVVVQIDPESFVVGRRRAELSTRNVLAARVEAVRPHRDGTVELIASWRGRAVRVALTAASVRHLGLAPGVRVVLFLKAVAIRRVPAGGSIPPPPAAAVRPLPDLARDARRSRRSFIP